MKEDDEREWKEEARLAREASRLKSEFLANMTHELRTPLNAIIGFTEVVYDGVAGPVSERQKEYLADVLGSARHLLQLIDDLLDLSRIEAGRLRFLPQPVDVREAAQEVLDSLVPVAEAKRIRCKLETAPVPGEVILDPRRLQQVVYNYLSNALKFTPEDGCVTVRVGAEGEHHLRLEVEDTGIGIPSEDIGRLFTNFQQLEAARTKKHGGTGLGLALTRRLVEAQGGRVGVESTPGQGSRFFAVLPRVAEGS